MDRRCWGENEWALDEAHTALGKGGVLCRVDQRGADAQRFVDCELASLAENRFGERADPWTLDQATRERWLEQARIERIPTTRKRSYEECYWVMRGGSSVGTLALSTFCLNDIAKLSSVYLRPSARGAGTMAETIQTVRAELESRGLGVTLDSPWCWQRAVRFYLKNGFWLRSWKRELAFQRHAAMPPPVIGIDEREGQAWIGAEVEGRTIVLARALRDRDTLLAHGREPDLPEDLDRLGIYACTTLSLVLALHGWPLVRLEEDGGRLRWSDLVHPEALADRIQAWEAWAVHCGWRVETPRIPGLEYPTWEEYEAVDSEEDEASIWRS